MGNLIASLPGSVAILGTDVPFGYVMIGGLVATFVLTGEHRGLRGWVFNSDYRQSEQRETGRFLCTM